MVSTLQLIWWIFEGLVQDKIELIYCISEMVIFYSSTTWWKFILRSYKCLLIKYKFQLKNFFEIFAFFHFRAS